jgi:hypothetical protein
MEYNLTVSAEMLLKYALAEDLVLETEVEGLHNADGSVNLDELIGVISDRDCDGTWLDYYTDRPRRGDFDDWYWEDQAWEQGY